MDVQKREYKRKYIRRFRTVQEVINQWDPVGLLPGDAAPFDEYELEIAQIVALLGKNPNDVHKTAEGIYKVFIKWFGEDNCPPIEECQRLATEIWKAIDDETVRD